MINPETGARAGPIDTSPHNGYPKDGKSDFYFYFYFFLYIFSELVFYEECRGGGVCIPY